MDNEVEDHSEEIERASKAIVELAQRFTSEYRIGRDGHLKRVQPLQPEVTAATPAALRSVHMPVGKGRAFGRA